MNLNYDSFIETEAFIFFLLTIRKDLHKQYVFKSIKCTTSNVVSLYLQPAVEFSFFFSEAQVFVNLKCHDFSHDEIFLQGSYSFFSHHYILPSVWCIFQLSVRSFLSLCWLIFVLYFIVLFLCNIVPIEFSVCVLFYVHVLTFLQYL